MVELKTTAKKTKRRKPKKTQARAAKLSKRILEVLAIRIEGAQFFEIREYAKEKGWRVTDSQLYRYIWATNRELAKNLEANREEYINSHLAKRRNIYAKAMQGGDLPTALKALESEAKLLGLVDPGTTNGAAKAGAGNNVAVQVNVGINGPTPDERRIELASILAALRDRAGDGADSGVIDGRVVGTNGNGKHITGGTNGHAG